MKRYLLSLICFATVFITGITELKASHAAGAEIWYEYIGNGTNHKYRVWLQFYRDVSGIPAPANPQLCVTSTCSQFSSFNMTFIQNPFVLSNPCNPANPNSGDTCLGVSGSILTPRLDQCVDVSSGGTFVQTEIYRYHADITLPGTCPKWIFSFSESARNVNDNLAGGGYLYVEATLNNTLGHNSSPRFINPAAKSFCVGTPFIWSQAANEPDGTDSMYFDFGDPLNGTCPNPTKPGFNAGYTRQQPMRTVNGITIDHRNGTFSFTPSNTEVVVINVVVTEYRFDTTITLWVAIGTSVRDLQVPVLQSCKAAAQAGPKLNLSSSGFSAEPVDADSLRNSLNGLGIDRVNMDSTQNGTNFNYTIGVINYDCYDTVVHLEFDIGVQCESISKNGSGDGSEFRLLSVGDSILRPIVKVDYTCNTELTVRKVDLVLHKPLDINGDYYLQIKKGNDGNTLTNECGFELQEFYTMIIRVKNCPKLNYKLENVTVVNDDSIRIKWNAIDSTYNKKLFTSWKILRANLTDGKVYEIKTIADESVRSFVDTFSDPGVVDFTRFDYLVQLVENFNRRAPTNAFSNILLTDSLRDDSTAYDIHWTPYLGWPAPSYEVFMAKVDTSSTGPLGWANYLGPDSGYYQTEFLLPGKNEITKADAGIYAFKVEATSPKDPNITDISQSNWIYIEIIYDPKIPEKPDTVIVPNVFTPNGDQVNDRFYVQAGNFDEISVAVYNRWGKLVYENTQFQSINNKSNGWDGTDMNSGQLLADGTYYYVITMKHNASGTTENKQGSLNIFSNGK